VAVDVWFSSPEEVEIGTVEQEDLFCGHVVKLELGLIFLKEVECSVELRGARVDLKDSRKIQQYVNLDIGKPWGFILP
jgi:hypothetical protein